MDGRDDASHTSCLAWCVLLTTVVAVRGGWLWTHYEDLRQDPDGYRHLAISLIQTGTYGYRADDSPVVHPTAYRPPLYPVLLAAVGWYDHVPLLAIAALHVVLGAATAAGVVQLGKSWHLGNWSWAAGVLTAVDPILLRQSSLVMTETAAAALAVAALLALGRLDRLPTWRNAALAGLTIGLAVLCRATFLVWFAAVAATWCLLPSYRLRVRLGLVAVLLAAGGSLLAVWFARNLLVLGHPVVATTHGGYTLLLGNNEGFYDYLRTADWGQTWDSRQLDARVNRVKASVGGDEVLVDRWAYAEAWQQIRRQPLMAVYASVVRAGRLWAVLPHQVDAHETPAIRGQRYAVAIWYSVLFLLAAAGAVRLGRRLRDRPYVWAVLLCLAFTAVHTVYWSNLRMRGPLMPALSLLAAGGLAWVVERLMRARRAATLSSDAPAAKK
jgi:hypothetical protein